MRIFFLLLQKKKWFAKRKMDLTNNILLLLLFVITDTLVTWEERERKVVFLIISRLVQDYEYSLAIQLIEDSIKISPNDPQLHSCLGRIYLVVSFNLVLLFCCGFAVVLL